MFLDLVVVNAGRRPWTGQWLSNLSQKCQATDQLVSSSQTNKTTWPPLLGMQTKKSNFLQFHNAKWHIVTPKQTYNPSIYEAGGCTTHVPCGRYDSVGRIILTNWSELDFRTARLTGLVLTRTLSGKTNRFYPNFGCWPVAQSQFTICHQQGWLSATFQLGLASAPLEKPLDQNYTTRRCRSNPCSQSIDLFKTQCR